MSKQITTANFLAEASLNLMQKAFNRSADSFSAFLGKKVSFDSVGRMQVQSIDTILNMAEPLSIIVSEMKGDLKGTCYLIFSNNDANDICEYQLGKAYSNNDELKDGLLMELANILTASFVTVLANELKIATYAHVPKLKRMDKIEMYKLLVSDEVHFNLSQKFRISYSIEDIKIQPVFTWAFDDNINKYITEWSNQTS
jgi:chemotaxis protein CheY-P-specific phosphatase CheC